MDEVEAFYDRNAQNEWDRLDRHKTEFAITLRALEEYMPRPPQDVLDIGGGPGRYSIALANRGYKVTLMRVGFTDSYFANPIEIRHVMESEKFETLDLVACEGIISMIEEKVNELDERTFEAWVELNYKLSKDPGIHGGAEHLLYVGRKKP